MEVIANELSIDNYVFDSYDKVKNFSNLYMELKKHGINTCRISYDDLQKIQGLLLNDSTKRNLLNLIYSFLRTPFEEGEGIENKEDEYLEAEWKYFDKNCLGLAMSYLTNGLSFSFCSEKWPAFVQITRNGTLVSARNAAKVDDVKIHAEWLDSFKEIQLVKSDIEPDKKKITLRHDHGKDVLYKFSKRIVRNPYIVGIVNSMPFNSKEKNFIKSFDENGLVECVLTWTDEGFGIVIQTTGRNYKETEKIAEILRNQFST